MQTKRHYLRKLRVSDPHRSPRRAVRIKHHWLAKMNEISSPKSNSSYYVRMHSQGFGNFAETNTKSLYVIKVLVV